ncbi:MAG: replication protein [Prevotellaceae bacterium]|jgi:DNA replication protein DnaC|nr:replication protein [Prevotellaceae bacterium]
MERTTYHFPEWYAEIAPDMLLSAYRTLVTQRDLTFEETAENIAVIGKAAKWLVSDSRKCSLLLAGTTGSGKTTLAQALCMVMETLPKMHNKNAQFTTDFLPEIKFKYITATRLTEIAIEDKPFYNEIRGCKYLLLDELGRERLVSKSYGNEMSAVIDVLCERYEKQLFTIATSNFNASELLEKYGLFVCDRITEMFNKIAFTEKSFRK